jgi:hypothetical protein
MEFLRNILGLPLENYERAKYNANAAGKRISEVIIDGVTITGYKAFSFVRKLSYVKSPVRSSDGSIGNLNSYSTFTTPTLQINFSLLSIDSYRDIMNLIYARREHLVECYDIVRDMRVKEKMYFEPEELPKLWTLTSALQAPNDYIIELLAVEDYTISMVGTNVPSEQINVVYYDKNNVIIASVQDVENTEFLIGGFTVQDVDGMIFNNSWMRVGYPTPYLNNETYRLALQTAAEKNTSTISFIAQYK